MTESETIEEYAHDCRIIREHIEDDEDRYHYEGPLGRVKSFYSPDHARIYADVHTITGGFREEKTGERGVPPTVARAREDVLIAYLVSNPTMGTEWVSRAYGLSEAEVRDRVQSAKARAAELREEGQDR